jgi:hypothetical protein
MLGHAIIFASLRVRAVLQQLPSEHRRRYLEQRKRNTLHPARGQSWGRPPWGWALKHTSLPAPPDWARHPSQQRSRSVLTMAGAGHADCPLRQRSAHQQGAAQPNHPDISICQAGRHHAAGRLTRNLRRSRSPSDPVGKFKSEEGHGDSQAAVSQSILTG